MLTGGVFVLVFCTEWLCAAEMWNSDVVKLSENRWLLKEGYVTLPKVKGETTSNLFLKFALIYIWIHFQIKFL